MTIDRLNASKLDLGHRRETAHGGQGHAIAPVIDPPLENSAVS